MVSSSTGDNKKKKESKDQNRSGKKINTGKIFEVKFRESIPKEVFHIRLNDPPSSFGKDSSKVRFSLKNPCDDILFYNNNLFCLELKTTGTSSFSFQTDKTNGAGKNIKLHQIKELFEMSNYKNVNPGFVLDFRTSVNTYWLDIAYFYNFWCITDKKSINEDDVKTLGGIIINKELKKVHYKYFILDLLEQIMERR